MKLLNLRIDLYSLIIERRKELLVMVGGSPERARLEYTVARMHEALDVLDAADTAQATLETLVKR